MKKLALVVFGGVFAVMMAGCTVSPRTGLVCPPATHPGPFGHRCIVD